MLAISVAGVMLTCGTATASLPPQPEAPDPEAVGFANGLETAVRGTQASPYVRAESPEQAMEILDALKSPEGVGPEAVKFGPCTLEPTRIYMRTSGGLGAKPYTKCEVPVTSIRQDTDLRYEGWFFWWLAKSYPGPGNQGQKSYEQKNVTWNCQGSDATTWAGTTVGTIVFGGETYYARVYQAPREEECGA